ncbi:MAG: hypothetical protein DHS20C11_08830 [Lysobacteraceae bacterium]|nr:MAG: hypothetical protein DHS20C11_08830 [Xanthomonadaceae bacterium]
MHVEYPDCIASAYNSRQIVGFMDAIQHHCQIGLTPVEHIYYPIKPITTDH